MSRISQETIQTVLKSVDIVQVIGETIPLHKKGKSYLCNCPFHDDHAPSMSVSQEKQIFKCFACGEAGNAISFVQKYHNISYPEAIKRLADRAGIKVDEGQFTERPMSEEAKRTFKMNEEFANYCNYLLSMDQESKKYLSDRDISSQTTNSMMLGCFHETDKMKHYMLAKGFQESELVANDLINIDGKSKWKDRLLIPIRDSYGNIRGFGGRRMLESDTAKYLNTAETDVFKKDTLLFHLDQALPEIRKEKKIFITEGYFDVIQAQQRGLKNVVAGLGTALTKSHMNLLSRLNAKVVLAYDGDNAGINAAIKNGKALLQQGIYPNAVLLPDGKDMDDICKENIQIIYDQSEQNFLEFRLKAYQSQGFESDRRFCLDFMKDLSCYKDPLMEDHYLRKLETKTGFSLESLKKQYRAMTDTENHTIQPKIIQRKTEINTSIERYQKGKIYVKFKQKPRLNYKQEIEQMLDTKKDKVMAFKEDKICDKKDVLMKYQEHHGSVLETQVTMVGYQDVEAHALRVADEIGNQLAKDLKIERSNLTYLGYLHTDTKCPHLHLQYWQKEPFLSEYKINTSLIKDIEKAIHQEMAQELTETVSMKL